MKRTIGTVLLLALLAGTAVNLLRGPRDAVQLSGPEADAYRLASELASSVASGSSVAWADQPPGYPILLAAVFAVAGTDVDVARGVQTLLGAILALLAFELARRMAGRGPGAGFLAAALVVLDSYWWLGHWSLTAESLLGVLVAGAALLLMGTGSDDRPRRQAVRVMLAGLLFGLGLLTKPLLLPAVLVAWLVPWAVPHGRRGRALVLTLVFCVTAALPVGAWTVWDTARLHVLVPVTAESGERVRGAQAPEILAAPTQPEVPAGDAADAVRPLLGGEDSRGRAGGNEVRPPFDPLILEHVLFKMLRTWSPATFFEADTPTVRLARMALIALNACVLIAFWAGVLKRQRGF